MRISDWSSDVCSSDLPIRKLIHQPSLDASQELSRERFSGTPAHHDHCHRANLRKLESRRCSTFRRISSIGTRTLPLPTFLNSRATSASMRSEEHTSELQSLMRISYAVFCLKKK